MTGERPRAGAPPLRSRRSRQELHDHLHDHSRDDAHASEEVPAVPDPERQVAFRTGISAESRAAALLVAKGFRILARRWRCPVGEIDIIARRRSLLVFV
jgi:Uncharacterised protein family UPF0102